MQICSFMRGYVVARVDLCRTCVVAGLLLVSPDYGVIYAGISTFWSSRHQFWCNSDASFCCVQK